MEKKILVAMLLLIFTSFMYLNAQWAKIYGGSDREEARSIQQTSDGGYIVAGLTGYTEASGTDYDVWVLKLTSTGNIEWEYSYGGTAVDGANSIQQTSDGGYIVAGWTYSFGVEGPDIWILKLSSTGDIEWQHTYGKAGGEGCSSIQQTDDEGYIVAGYTESFGVEQRDFWVLKLTLVGDIEWQRAYGRPTSYKYGSSGETSNDRASSVHQTLDGGYIVVGGTYIAREGSDILVLKLFSNGDIEWAQVYGEYGDEYVSSIQQTRDGGYVVAGETWSITAGQGENDFLILKLGQAGEIDTPCEFIRGSVATITIPHHQPPPEITSMTPWDTNVVPLDTTVVPQDTNVTVIQCAQKYSLALSITGEGITIPSARTHIYYDGTEVQIEAIPDTDYIFNGWTGDVSLGHENDNPITITMDSDKSITANFALPVLTIIAGIGGTTDPAPDTYTYDEGTEVTITAMPNSGYEFSGWSGDASRTTNPITITMDSDKSITANFSATAPPEKPEKKGGCFIATAVYSSSIHSHVRILQDFRDKYLMPSKLGSKLVRLYYKYSPSIANLIAKHIPLKVAVRISLLPLVVFSYSILNFGPTITAIIIVFVFVLPVFLISFFRRRLRRLEAKDPKALASLG